MRNLFHLPKIKAIQKAAEDKKNAEILLERFKAFTSPEATNLHSKSDNGQESKSVIASEIEQLCRPQPFDREIINLRKEFDAARARMEKQMKEEREEFNEREVALLDKIEQLTRSSREVDDAGDTWKRTIPKE